MIPLYLLKGKQKRKSVVTKKLKTLAAPFPGGPKPELCQVGESYCVNYPQQANRRTKESG